MHGKGKIFFLAVSLMAFLVVSFLALGGNFSSLMVFFWTLSVLSAGVFWFSRKEVKDTLKAFDMWDLWILLLLFLVFAPLYLYKIYEVPWQINTDEVTIMHVAKDLLRSPSTEVLGLSWYFGFPSLIFVVFGKLASLLGGIDLLHFRLLHALSGLFIVMASFVLFRLLAVRKIALIATVVLGVNHSLFAISRMAMRDNTGLFLEILALAFAVLGVKYKSFFASFLAGVFMALGFYTYFPGRVTLFIWILTLFLLAFFYRKAQIWKGLVKYVGVAMFAFVLTATPVLLASFSQSASSQNYQKQQFLFFKEGGELQMQWSGKATWTEAWLANIKQGLLTFNSSFHDHGYIYPNFGHGFADPLSGGLLWVGIFLVAYRFFWQRKTLADTLVLTGFFSLYLAFAFLITKAPNYTRLLVILPFFAYLVACGLVFISKVASSVFPKVYKKLGFWVVACFLVFIVIFLNLRIFGQFVQIGKEKGSDVGSTARFVEAKKDKAGLQWILVADHTYPYYAWGEPSQWATWLGFFKGDLQDAVVLVPADLPEVYLTSATTLLTTRQVLVKYLPVLKTRYPDLAFSVVSITPDGRLIAVEMEEK